MKTRRWRQLPWWLAGTYLCWSLFVYFGSMGGEGHDWWPIMLYPVIWPLSLIEHALSSYLCDQLIPDPQTASTTTWIVLDALSGAFYIVVGTLWIWFLGKMISLGVTHLFEREKD